MLVERASTPPQARERVRVLVVDDNAGFRDSLVSLLDTDELVVVGQAGNGEQALELIESTTPHVVLMDVRMPTMDGIETTRRLKALDPSIGIVALTGLEDQRAVRDMLVAGASGYVLKDSDGDEILTAVREAALGGGVISPQLTPTVIEELTEALERERRRTRQLEIAQEALLERAARRHELVSRLGHELRTPVTVIFGMAQTLADGTAPEEDRDELLGRLVARSRDLARLVQRFEAAVEAGLTEWADVTEVAREVSAGRGRVQVDAPSTPAMASLNRMAACRILEELIENALAFSSDPDPVVVRVTIEDGTPIVRVIDRGEGIEPSALPRIFAPLEQGEALNARTHQGIGLGLAIARMSARAMDGDVILEATGSEGSTFTWLVSRAPAPGRFVPLT
jgi:DNA-binding NarL/FixJ family response regulator/anti-sigma regulatory factor (Ser/Thr protein kinase)